MAELPKEEGGVVRLFCFYLSPLAPAHLSLSRLAHRGRRRSRRFETEQGAVSDNDIALERREAQGSRAEGPRAPGPPPPSLHLGPGILARDTGLASR